MIELASPGALLALLSVPVLLVLYSLRPRRRTALVPSTALWHEALRERQRGLGLRRLLRDLGLLALLLAAVGLSLALADPRWRSAAREPGDAVLVLDASASMRARGSGGTRFELARRRAVALVDALPEGARMLVMTSGRRPVLRSAFEADRAALRAILAGLEPTDEAGRPAEALGLALALLRDRDRGRVHFVTDGAFDDRLGLAGAPVEVHRVGEPAPNLAITRFDVRAEIGAEDRFQALVTVRNFTGTERRVPLAISLEGRAVARREIALAPHARETLVVPFRGRRGGRARAAIEVEDALGADDRAFAVVGTDEPLRVLLVSPGSFYLESALAALPNASVTRRAGLDPGRLGVEARRHDVVVLDRVPAPALPPGRYLLVDTVPPGAPFTAVGTVAHPAVAGRSDAPLVRGLDLTGLRIDAARRVEVRAASPGLERLLWSPETDLALAWIEGGVRAVYLGFDPARSNLPLRAAFPLFLGESLEWLRPRAARLARTQQPAGEPIVMEVADPEAEIVVRTPAGEGITLAPEKGRLRFEDTSRAGLYRVTVAGVPRDFAVNLADERESDIEPRAPAPEGAAAEARAGAAAEVSRPVWPYLAALVLVLLALEWGLRWGRGARA